MLHFGIKIQSVGNIPALFFVLIIGLHTNRDLKFAPAQCSREQRFWRRNRAGTLIMQIPPSVIDLTVYQFSPLPISAARCHRSQQSIAFGDPEALSGRTSACLICARRIDAERVPTGECRAIPKEPGSGGRSTAGLSFWQDSGANKCTVVGISASAQLGKEGVRCRARKVLALFRLA